MQACPAPCAQLTRGDSHTPTTLLGGMQAPRRLAAAGSSRSCSSPGQAWPAASCRRWAGSTRRPQQRRAQLATQAAAGASESAGTDEPGVPRPAVGTVFTQQFADVAEGVAFPLDVPILPFAVEEVMLPGSVKTLHLFEARYISLLEEVLASGRANKLFVHAVVEQQGGGPIEAKAAGFPGACAVGGVVLLMGCLVRVLEVRSLQIGALVKIQAEGRVAIRSVQQLTPYMRGSVDVLQDERTADSQQGQLAEQAQQLVSTMQDLQNLTQTKFRSKQTAALQHSMYWHARESLFPAVVEANSSSDEASSVSGSSGQDGSGGSSNGGVTAEAAARLSFAALQALPEASPKEQLQLLRCCVNAMETRDTCKRLALVNEHMGESLKLLAAKCALKSLSLS